MSNDRIHSTLKVKAFFSNGSLTGSVRFLYLISLDVSSADQHTLEGTQTKVIVRLIGQLLITQPENHRESKTLDTCTCSREVMPINTEYYIMFKELATHSTEA